MRVVWLMMVIVLLVGGGGCACEKEGEFCFERVDGFEAREKPWMPEGQRPSHTHRVVGRR